MSRMLKKLNVLHPLYRSKVMSVVKNNFFKTETTEEQVWNDYDALFSVGTHLFSYSVWLNAFSHEMSSDLPTKVDKNIENSPQFSVIMPTFKPSFDLISQAIESVLNQEFKNWELIIVDDGSGDVDIQRLLLAYAHKDSRIKVQSYPENRHISAASNQGLAAACGKWIILLDHDDLLEKTALSHVDDAINVSSDCALVYSDVDKIDEGGARSDPYFKPDWNPDLFLSQNIFSHLSAYRSDLVRSVGGFRLGLEGAQDYDLALRCIEKIRPVQIVHIPRVLYHWRIHAGSTAHSTDAKPYAMLAGERALNDHFARLAIQAKAQYVGYGYRVRYALPIQLPLVSLIIPTRNGGKLLQKSVDSILAKTSYSAYEIIIVDNGSEERATLRYLDSLSANPKIRVLRDPRPFNYSALNNAAVKLARGDVIGLVNDDVEVITPDWLSEMVSHAVRHEVGAVGARLWYIDDTLQHAGLVLGIHGIAGHVHRYLPKGNVGYCGRAALIQDFSAVTGACLVVRREVYDKVGGLDEALAVACNDVDFCLRLLEAGYRNIWTPYAELYHHESVSRGFDNTPEKQARSAREVAYMKQRWGDLLLNDPAYNPNLTLEDEDFGLAWPPRVAPFAVADVQLAPE
ncbi:glycosyltransferase [Limnohabitans sp. WS1]|uniref:glycosyltransferase family 2 protein n=1 Tax=Limnohabitans sp. WS1 TaxID=1100726 RepID=UPI000D3CFD6C|nr:glycosyltransferase family 2 protein [Limnohabitans sp. WS1]